MPRITAATWVAATGALLLLVAAATFLAVSWDVLGLTARVAVVGSVTGAAIVGGHLLRRVVPSVGAVVFHLGALLLPVDALGLALQLDLSLPATWTLTGAVALVALPPLAIAGRSRVLAAAAVAGIPVVATGLGLWSVLDPSLAVAIAAAASLATLSLRGTRVARVWQAAPATLAIIAVTGPLVAAALDALLFSGTVAVQITASGWAPTTWTTPVLVGAVSVGSVAIRAHHERSPRVAVLAPVLAVVTGIVAILPAGTPRLAVLLIVPIVALLLELVALVGADDPTWSSPLRWAAGGIEVLGAWFTAAVIATTVSPGVFVGPAADPELAAAYGLAAVAWVVAALRRRSPSGRTNLVVPAVVGAATVYAAAAMAVGLPGERSPLAATLLLAVAAAGVLRTLTLELGSSTGVAEDQDRAERNPGNPAIEERDRSGRLAAVTAAVATGLALIAAMAAASTMVALPVAALVAPIIGLHVRALLGNGNVGSIVVATFALPLGVLSALLLALSVGDREAAPSFLAALDGGALPVVVAVVSLLGMAAAVDVARPVADLIRGVGALVAVLAVGVTALPDGLLTTASATQAAALSALRPAPSILLVLVIAVSWLLADAVRLRSRVIATITAPLVVRLTATIVVVAGGGAMEIGIALLVITLVAAAAALIGPVDGALPTSVTAVLAAVPGWALIAATPAVRAWALVGIGLLLVAVGVARRLVLVGHLGGVVTIVGVWLLLSIHEVVAVDLWLLPVAAQLAVLGWQARRRGPVSSWITDVPPLLLVAIPAIAERLADGPGYHGVLAGALALVAIIHGGVTGRGGPLVSGIAVVLAVVVVETVAYAALVPTWAWFAIAGVVLLGAAVLIERQGMSAGRAVDRLKDLVRDDDPDSDGGSADSARPGSRASASDR